MHKHMQAKTKGCFNSKTLGGGNIQGLAQIMPLLLQNLLLQNNKHVLLLYNITLKHTI